MSDSTHCSSKLINNPMKENSTPLSKRSNMRTSKSTLSTLDISVKVVTIPIFSELDSLYQQYLNIKSERKKSQMQSCDLISKVNYIEKEQKISQRLIKKIKSDVLTKERSYLMNLDSKEKHDIINAQRKSSLMKQKEKNAKLKSSIDYVSRTWKDHVRVKHETISNKIRLVKYKNESWKNKVKMNESQFRKEKCSKMRNERAASAEKRELYQTEKRQLKKNEIIHKIKIEKEKKEDYEKLIKTFQGKGEEILSRIEDLEIEKQLILDNEKKIET